MSETPFANKIVGVELKPLTTHGDQRGFFREVVRHTDSLFAGGQFAQWSHSKMQRNVVKAWHYHHVQYDWWYVPLGVVETVLYDNRTESPTYQTKLVFKMGERRENDEDILEVCVRIPPGVLHACKVLSDYAHLFYITSETYNPDDEGRFAYNSGPVEHDWGPDVIVAANDKKDFVPTATRTVLVS